MSTHLLRGVTLLLCTLAGAADAGRPIQIEDLARLLDVSEPQLSPDARQIVYVLTRTDPVKDRTHSDLWLVPWAGGTPRALTHTEEDESSPRWMADGRALGFLSSRGVEHERTQLWRLSIDGGDAERISDVPGSVEDYAFAPNGKQVALIVSDPDPADARAEDATPPPRVIDRFYFKQDPDGYLDGRRKHLYVLDLATGQSTLLTPGAYDELLPSWSPDSRLIAFVSKREGADPDRHDTFGIYLIEPRAGAQARLLTQYQGAGGDTEWAVPPQFSPDGKQLAYVAGGDPKLIYYARYGIQVVPVAGGAPRPLSPGLDRNSYAPQWSADGRSIHFLLEDDRSEYLATQALKGGALKRLTQPGQSIQAHSRAGERIVVLRSTPQQPAELLALERGQLRTLTAHNAALLAELDLAPVEAFDTHSPDGTRVGGFLVRPLGYQPGQRVPTLLRIHGGPVAQFTHDFRFEWQLFAAHGYAVVAGNPRGSSGRGEAYSTAIYANWGGPDVADVLALVDHAVAIGVADPERLGVGGWSYGGMLTNYVIASDRRFKAATSGASIANILAGFGTDMYTREYLTELGAPWAHSEVWTRISYPFLHADRIRTPTLFLCGDADFNVPLLNSEQMYQALRTLDVPSRLIIYPGETHGLEKPSYLKDRLTRYLDWYEQYLR